MVNLVPHTHRHFEGSNPLLAGGAEAVLAEQPARTVSGGGITISLKGLDGDFYTFKCLIIFIFIQTSLSSKMWIYLSLHLSITSLIFIILIYIVFIFSFISSRCKNWHFTCSSVIACAKVADVLKKGQDDLSVSVITIFAWDHEERAKEAMFNVYWVRIYRASVGSYLDKM